MTAISEIMPSVLTDLSAPVTKECPVNLRAWAEWLKIQTFNDPELEALVEVCAKFCRRIKEGKPASWLSLFGKSDTGKTHCGRRIWESVKARFDWQNCLYVGQPVYWPRLVDELRAAGSGMGDAPERLRDMINWPILLLDDMGAERDTTGYAAEKLNMLLGSRVGKWTIITANLDLEQIGKIDARIASRIIREPGNLFLEMTTTPYALRLNRDQIAEGFRNIGSTLK